MRNLQANEIENVNGGLIATAASFFSGLEGGDFKQTVKNAALFDGVVGAIYRFAPDVHHSIAYGFMEGALYGILEGTVGYFLGDLLGHGVHH